MWFVSLSGVIQGTQDICKNDTLAIFGASVLPRILILCLDGTTFIRKAIRLRKNVTFSTITINTNILHYSFVLRFFN